MSTTSIRVLLAVAALAAAGCGRAHLTKSFGTATRQAFAVQPAHPTPTAEPNQSLDTQEAQVIAASYVRSLAGETTAAEPEPVLLVAPGYPGQPARLAPSVPKE